MPVRQQSHGWPHKRPLLNKAKKNSIPVRPVMNHMELHGSSKKLERVVDYQITDQDTTGRLTGAGHARERAA